MCSEQSTERHPGQNTVESAGQNRGEAARRASPLTAADMGRVLHTFRAWPGPYSWVVLAILMVGLGTCAVIAPIDHPLWFIIFATLLPSPFWAAFLLPGGLEKSRVCEHGLVLGYRKQSATRYFVPWSTMDPDLVTVLRRANMLTRHPGFYQGVPNYRFTPAYSKALAVYGLNTLRANGMLRAAIGPAASATLARPRLGLPSLTWYFLGTQRLDEFVHAIEEAMVADGYENARGMADRALGNVLVVPWKADPDLLPYPL